MIQQPSASGALSFNAGLSSHQHVDTETCAWCEQDIPPEKLLEISGKIATKEREHTKAIAAKLEQQHAIDKAQAEAKAKADLDLERQLSALRETAVREETLKLAEATAAEKLAEAQRNREKMQAELQEKLTQEAAARIAAELAGSTLQAQYQQLRQDNEAALAAMKAEAEAREAEIRTEAQQAAQAAMAKKLAENEATRVLSEAALQARITEAEAIKVAAEQKGMTLQVQLDALQKLKDEEITKIKEDAEAAATRSRQEAIEAAEAVMGERVAEKDKALAEAHAKNAEAEDKFAKLSEQHELTLKEQLDSQRETLEKAKDEAINAEKAKAFEETQKLHIKVNELQRALENKSNEELGEGAEVNIYEALRAEFPDDRITRVAKGAPGADIIHVVMHNGVACGKIIYDSKNHKAFRHEHVAKLKVDQLAEKAEHAILSTHRFPKGANQLHMQDSVLLANPARVKMLASMIRQHLLLVHTLRLSDIERESKTAALYDFITSERCTQLLGRVDERAQELLVNQVAEIKWHENNWKKQGEALRSIQKAKADLGHEISLIIGTTADEDITLEASEL